MPAPPLPICLFSGCKTDWLWNHNLLHANRVSSLVGYCERIKHWMRFWFFCIESGYIRLMEFQLLHGIAIALSGKLMEILLLCLGANTKCLKGVLLIYMKEQRKIGVRWFLAYWCPYICPFHFSHLFRLFYLAWLQFQFEYMNQI